MTDPLVDRVLDDLYEHFADLDDDDEPPFGEYARVRRRTSNQINVWHETEPVGVRITVEKIKGDGLARARAGVSAARGNDAPPKTPVVLHDERQDDDGTD